MSIGKEMVNQYHHPCHRLITHYRLLLYLKLQMFWFFCIITFWKPVKYIIVSVKCWFKALLHNKTLNLTGRVWVSATLLSGVQNGALFLASARWVSLNFSKRSARWAPFSFLALFLIPLGLWNFLKIEIFHSFIVFRIYFFQSFICKLMHLEANQLV